MDTQDGASWKNEDGDWKLRDPKKTKQRKLRRGKKREERRKYGHSAKRRAEYKADAQVKARAMAQAAMSGGDDTAGVNDSSWNPTGSVTEGTFQYGGSMKTNQSGGGYNAENPAAAARQLKRNQRKEGREKTALVSKTKRKATKDPSAWVASEDIKKKMVTEKRADRMEKRGWKKHKRMGASMNAYQDKEASMDDYSHEKKLGADGRYDLEHGHKDWAKNDFDHAHALKKDAHHDAEQRKHAHPILKHMRKF